MRMPCIGRSIGSSTGGTTPVRFPIVLVVFPYDEHYGAPTTVLISSFIMIRWGVQTASDSFSGKHRNRKQVGAVNRAPCKSIDNRHTHTFIHSWNRTKRGHIQYTPSIGEARRERKTDENHIWCTSPAMFVVTGVLH